MKVTNLSEDFIRISSCPTSTFNQFDKAVMTGSQDKEDWNKRGSGPLKFMLEFILDEGQLFQSFVFCVLNDKQTSKMIMIIEMNGEWSKITF